MYYRAIVDVREWKAVMTFDAVVVGTGAAGLSAALTLGRARRETLEIDSGPGRDARVILAAAHGTLAAIVIDHKLLDTQPRPTNTVLNETETNHD